METSDRKRVHQVQFINLCYGSFLLLHYMQFQKTNLILLQIMWFVRMNSNMPCLPTTVCAQELLLLSLCCCTLLVDSEYTNTSAHSLNTYNSICSPDTQDIPFLTLLKMCLMTVPTVLTPRYSILEPHSRAYCVTVSYFHLQRGSDVIRRVAAVVWTMLWQ